MEKTGYITVSNPAHPVPDDDPHTVSHSNRNDSDYITPPTRDIPEWQRRYMPPSLVAAASGVALAGLLYMLGKKNNR
jgi:hypothetical protein